MEYMEREISMLNKQQKINILKEKLNLNHGTGKRKKKRKVKKK